MKKKMKRNGRFMIFFCSLPGVEFAIKRLSLPPKCPWIAESLFYSKTQKQMLETINNSEIPVVTFIRQLMSLALRQSHTHLPIVLSPLCSSPRPLPPPPPQLPEGGGAAEMYSCDPPGLRESPNKLPRGNA